MTEIMVKIDGFEGPLDLLLHLIKRLEMNIYDIPISEITSQYLSYVHTMKLVELDTAGDYLVMAATLMSIKSNLLLPQQRMINDEEEFYEDREDPRSALVEQLLEYQKYKQAAIVLRKKQEKRNDYFTKEPENLDIIQKDYGLEPGKLNVSDLVHTFKSLLEKKKEDEPIQTKVTVEEISIEQKMENIILKLSDQLTLPFTELVNKNTKRAIVTTFVALLELIKKQQIEVRQNTAFDEILISLKNTEKQGVAYE